MSTTGENKRDVISAIRRVWALGGVRAYYRGLTVGLVGVFPLVFNASSIINYSADRDLDMQQLT